MVGYRRFGPAVSDGIPVGAGQTLSLRVLQHDGGSVMANRIRFGIHQLQPEVPSISGGGVSPAFPGGAPAFEVGMGLAATGLTQVLAQTDVSIDVPISGAGLAVAWRPQGDLMAAAGEHSQQLTVIDTATGLEVPGWPGPFSSSGFAYDVAWSPDGSRLAVGHRSQSGTRACFSVIDVESRTVEAGWPTYDGNMGADAIAWSPGGDRLAVGLSAAPFFDVIDVATKKRYSGWYAFTDEVQSVAWSPDASRLAVAHAAAPYLSVLDTNTGQPESGWPTLPAPGLAVAWSPDGSLLAVGTDADPYGLVIDVDSRAEQSGWPELSASARAVAWSPDASRLAFGLGPDGLVVCTVADKATETAWLAPSDWTLAASFAYDPGNVSSG